MLPRRLSILRMRKGCGGLHQRADVAHRAHVDLAARQEGHGAVEIDGEAALHLVEDLAGDGLVLLERSPRAGPSSPRGAPSRATASPRRARSRRAPDRPRPRRRDSAPRPCPRTPNSLSGTRPSTFRPTSMTAMSFSMATTRALDDGALGEIALGERLFQKGGKILPGRLRFATCIETPERPGPDGVPCPAPVGWHCTCRPRPPRSSRAGRRVMKPKATILVPKRREPANDKRAHPKGAPLSCGSRSCGSHNPRPPGTRPLYPNRWCRASKRRARAQRRIGPRRCRARRAA